MLLPSRSQESVEASIKLPTELAKNYLLLLIKTYDAPLPSANSHPVFFGKKNDLSNFFCYTSKTCKLEQ